MQSLKNQRKLSNPTSKQIRNYQTLNSTTTTKISNKKLPSGEGDASGSSDSGELSEAGESDQVEAENI